MTQSRLDCGPVLGGSLANSANVSMWDEMYYLGLSYQQLYRKRYLKRKLGGFGSVRLVQGKQSCLLSYAILPGRRMGSHDTYTQALVYI
jgi:hypothetical protein